MDAVADRLAGIPTKYKGIYKKAMRGRSMKAAIRAQCLECMGWQTNEVKACSDAGCPLYPYRNTSKPKKRQEIPANSDKTGFLRF